MRRKALVKLSPQLATHFNIHQSSSAREMGKFTGNSSFHFCCVVILLFFATRGALCRSHLSRNTWRMRWCYSTGAQTFSVSRAGLEVNEKPLWAITKGQTSADIKSEACWWEKLDAKLCNGISRPAIIAPEKCVIEGEDAHYRSLIAMRRRTTRFIKLSRRALFALLKGKQTRKSFTIEGGHRIAMMANKAPLKMEHQAKRFTRSRAEINLET